MHRNINLKLGWVKFNVPPNTLEVISGTGFYGSNDPTNSGMDAYHVGHWGHTYSCLLRHLHHCKVQPKFTANACYVCSVHFTKHILVSPFKKNIIWLSSAYHPSHSTLEGSIDTSLSSESSTVQSVYLSQLTFGHIQISAKTHKIATHLCNLHYDTLRTLTSRNRPEPCTVTP